MKYEESVKSIDTIKKRNKVEYIVVNIICLFVFLAFGYVTIMSFLQTSELDENNYIFEKILYNMDNVLLNILFFSIFIIFMFIMRKCFGFLSKVSLNFLETGLVVYVIILGLVWVFSVFSIPEADSKNIFETATEVISNDYSSINSNGTFYNSDYYNGYSYYNYYPFQLGFVFISEIVYRIFGSVSSMPMQIINVICVAVAYLGIVKIAKHLFNSIAIEIIAIFLLAGCFQPILFCTFVYGNIIGMCCAIWASYFLIRYIKGSKYILLLPCGILLVLAVMAKYNNLIYLVAFVIALVIHTIKEKKWQGIAFSLVLCVLVVGINNLVIVSYENRADTKLAKGVSQIMYLDMGINESFSAPGWYNGVALETYKDSGLDNKVAEQKACEDIQDRLNIFIKDPKYAVDFFSKKITSQWNEPTFESIWVSKVKAHEYPINSIANEMYYGGLGQFFKSYFNLYIQILYLLFVIGTCLLPLKNKANIETVLFLLVILGGFGYHLLFEGKSQYILVYIPLLIPTAAFGLNTLVKSINEKVKGIYEKVSNIKISVV